MDGKICIFREEILNSRFSLKILLRDLSKTLKKDPSEHFSKVKGPPFGISEGENFRNLRNIAQKNKPYFFVCS